jgi:hypothetical protein
VLTFSSQRKKEDGKGRRKVTSSEQGNGGGTWRGHDLKRQHDGNEIWQRKRRLRQGRIKSYFVGDNNCINRIQEGVTLITTDRHQQDPRWCNAHNN